MSVIAAPETALCKYMRTVEALRAHPGFDADDALTVESWLSADTPAEHVRVQLRAAGYSLSSSSIKEHRRNVCSCSVAS